MKTMKRMLSLFLVAVTLCGVIAMPAFAASTQAFDILSSSKYAKTYTLSSSGKTIPYTSNKLSTRGTVTYGASSSSYIDNKADELYIFDVGCTNGTYWAYVSYPTSSRRVNAYIPLSALTKNNGSHAKTVSTGKFYCSLRENTSTSSSYYVAKGDTVYLVATSGSKYQILYPVSNGKYRLAWCNASDYKKHCGTNTTNTSNKTTTTTSIIGGQSDTPKDGAFVRIRYAANGRYLDVPAEGATKNGTQLQIWDSASSNTNQYFQLIDTGKGWQIISLHSGKVVEVRDSSHKDCAQVAQWDKHNSACARWDIIRNSDGTVSFKNRESGLYLNVYGGGNAGNGTKLIQYHNDGTVAMKFYINNVSTNGYNTQTSKISGSSVKSEKNISLTSWRPLNGLTQTMLQQDDSLEALVDVPATLDAANFVLSWVSNSKEVTRIRVAKGNNGQMTIRYGTSIEQNRSGRKMSLAQMLTEAHRGEAAYVLWAAGDADKCIRNWFGLSGSGKYSMEMTFGKVPLGEYGYYLLIEKGTVYQVPIINVNSSYKVYRKLNGKTTYMFDAAQILRNAKLQLDDNAAAVVMRQLVKNGYIK